MRNLTLTRFTIPYLTLTRVVFEFRYFFSFPCKQVHLTLTRVVFECNMEDAKKLIERNLTLTRVVFECI